MGEAFRLDRWLDIALFGVSPTLCLVGPEAICTMATSQVAMIITSGLFACRAIRTVARNDSIVFWVSPDKTEEMLSSSEIKLRRYTFSSGR